MSNWAQQIEDDLSWREAELATLKVQIAEADKGSVKQITLLRAIWALLYAHYEGFCKFIWDLYLDELQKTGILRKDAMDNIAILSLQRQFKASRGDTSATAIWELCKTKFNNWLSEPLDFQLKLETNSNLWPNLLKANSLKAGLPCQMVDTYERQLTALVARRNEIAHGQKMVIDSLDEYQKYENAALLVMHELALAVSDALDQRQYLKAP